MILAALKPDSKQEVQEMIIDAVAQVMSGTPDAARAEPFTWVNVVGFVAVILIFVIAAYLIARQQNEQSHEQGDMQIRQTEKLADAIKEMNDRQDVQQGRCHDTSLTCIKMATEASNRSAAATDNNTRILEKVIAKLG